MSTPPPSSPSPTKAKNNMPTRNGVVVNYGFLLAYLVGLSAFGSFVNDMYVPSLPSMTRYFHCSVPTVQIGLTMGMAGLGIGQMLLGPISDKYGRKPVLVISILVFIVAAVVSIFSPTIHFFLGSRFLQGVGASGGYFLARTIPADLYAGRALAKTMAIVGAINGIAPAGAPAIGGVLSQHFGWQSVFAALAAYALLLLCWSFRLKETLPVADREKGSLWASFADYKGLLANKRFVTHIMLKGTALGVLFAYISAAPFIMQTHFGLRQDVFGCVMGGNTIFLVIGSMLALKFRPLKKAAVVASICLMITQLAMAYVLFRTDSFWAFEILLWPMLFFMGMIFTVGNTLAMNEGRDKAGVASALLGVTGYIFGATVAPLVGMGNIMHSTAIVLLVMSALTLICGIFTKYAQADLDS